MNNVTLGGCKKYEIQSDFLYELLTYGDGLESKYGLSNWNIDHGPAKPLLTVIAMQAFGIYRLPWYQDTSFCRPLVESKYQQAIEKIKADEISHAIDDAKCLYQHTQNTLAELGLSRITLNRSLYNTGKDCWGSEKRLCAFCGWNLILSYSPDLCKTWWTFLKV